MESHALESPCLKLSTTLLSILYKSLSVYFIGLALLESPFYTSNTLFVIPEGSSLSRQEATAITGRLASQAEAIGDRHTLLGLLAMGVLVLRLARDHPAVDKKLLRQLLDLHTQANAPL